MTKMETAGFETDLSLFKYDNVERLPEPYRGLTEQERTERIAAARETLGDDVVVLGHNYQRREIVEAADFVGDSYHSPTAFSPKRRAASPSPTSRTTPRRAST